MHMLRVSSGEWLFIHSHMTLSLHHVTKQSVHGLYQIRCNIYVVMKGTEKMFFNRLFNYHTCNGCNKSYFLICFQAWAKLAQQWLLCVPLGIHQQMHVDDNNIITIINCATWLKEITVWCQIRSSLSQLCAI